MDPQFGLLEQTASRAIAMLSVRDRRPLQSASQAVKQLTALLAGANLSTNSQDHTYLLTNF